MIAVTGLGAISSVGANTRELRDAIRQGRTGIGPLTRFDCGTVAARPVCQVPELPPGPGSASHRLALAAADEAVRDAGCDARRAAILVGTTTGGISDSERWYLSHLAGAEPDPGPLRHHAASTISHAVAQALGSAGPRVTLSTACSSGANTITMGADMLRAGLVNVAIAGGTDALCQMTYFGFASLKLMSDEPCRPFDRDRTGLNLGEGAAFLVLERLDDAVRRGAHVYAILSGSAVSCDAHHMTSPAPDGASVVAALRGALTQAGLSAADIDYINAHGTATPANDTAEAAALASVFGAATPPTSASKSFLGHTLGAAGALEAVITVLAIVDGFIPATLNTQTPEDGAPPDLVLGRGRQQTVQHALSTSFAFGGNNGVLIFSGADQ